MGRRYTGAQLTTSALQLDAGHLRRTGVIVPGRTVQASLSWKSGAQLQVESTWTEKKKGLRLVATVEGSDGKLESWAQDVALHVRPSNLGKGEVLSFVCPRSGRTCRKLYRAYYSRGFFHREAFSYRLYYPAQTCSRLQLPDHRYQQAEEDLLRRKRRTSSYKGAPTKNSLRRSRLVNRLAELEEIRWSPPYIPLRLVKALELLTL